MLIKCLAELNANRQRLTDTIHSFGIDANIINPRIVGKSLKISPLLVLFAVTFGGAYFGILGMFLAVPVIAVIKILLDDFINYREAKKKR